MFEDKDGAKAGSLTLDEATDAILLDSSTDNNLEYKAANIATDKETFPVEALRPTVPVHDTSGPERRDLCSRTTGKRNSKSQKARQRKFETDTKTSPVISESNDKPTQRIVGTPNKADTMKPPKLESKCNCIIM